jgi:hypothetical protein
MADWSRHFDDPITLPDGYASSSIGAVLLSHARIGRASAAQLGSRSAKPLVVRSRVTSTAVGISLGFDEFIKIVMERHLKDREAKAHRSD